MESDQIYDYLVQAKTRNAILLLTFDDSDKYSLADVDLCYSIGRNGSRETEPLVVAFDDCLNESNKRLEAYRDGELKTPGVYWTSVEPIAPVQMQYSVEDIVTIWDDNKNYAVYNRSSE